MTDARRATTPTGRFLFNLVRDWGFALGVAFLAWTIWVRFLAPGPLSSGPAPGFTLPDPAGGNIALSNLGEGPILLNFWFTSCGPCRAEMPEIARFHANHPEIPLIGVSIDDMPAQRLAHLSRQLGITWPVAQDAGASVSQAYGVSSFPTTILVRDGQIEDVHLGAINAAGLERLVAP